MTKSIAKNQLKNELRCLTDDAYKLEHLIDLAWEASRKATLKEVQKWFSKKFRELQIKLDS